MRSEANKSFTHGFVLSEQELRRIHDIMYQQMKTATTPDDEIVSSFEIKYQNGVISNPESLDEIVAQENFGSTAIRRLLMSTQAKAGEGRNTISVQFTNIDKADSDENDRPVKFKVIGNDRDWVFVTSSHLEERIGRAKTPSLSSRFFRDISLAVMILLLLAFVFGFEISNKRALAALVMLEQEWKSGAISQIGDLILAVEKERILQQGYMNMFGGSTMLWWGVGMTFAFLLSLFGKPLLHYLFPPYHFLWGDYVKFYESRKGMRNLILVVIMLGIVVSVVANYVYGFLTK